MPRTVMSKSKSEVEFQYGGRLFFSKAEIVTSQPWIDMTMKFGVLLDDDFRMTVISSYTKPQVVQSRRGRHLENVYDVITARRVARFGRNLVV